jgi:MerT mercuric transport protein
LELKAFMNKSKVLEEASLGGTILAAITASLCCIGPLVAVALGAGGFVASSPFEKWRTVFLGVTFALLALAWYLTYRKPKAACAEGAARASTAQAVIGARTPSSASPESRSRGRGRPRSYRLPQAA